MRRTAGRMIPKEGGEGAGAGEHSRLDSSISIPGDASRTGRQTIDQLLLLLLLEALAI